MKDFVEEYYFQPNFDDTDGYDKERAQRKAFSVILPIIMKQELTERQNICLRYHYVMGKSQQEIADILKLSQPTVSRHINAAKNIVNNKLCYCYAALHTALDEYDRLAG